MNNIFLNKKYGFSLVETSVAMGVLAIVVAGSVATSTYMNRQVQHTQLMSNKVTLESTVSRYLQDPDLLARSALLVLPKDDAERQKNAKFGDKLRGNAKLLYLAAGGVPKSRNKDQVLGLKDNPECTDEDFAGNSCFLGPSSLKPNSPLLPVPTASNDPSMASSPLPETEFALINPSVITNDKLMNGLYLKDGSPCTATDRALCDLEIFISLSPATKQDVLLVQFKVIPIKLSSAQIDKIYYVSKTQIMDKINQYSKEFGGPGNQTPSPLASVQPLVFDDTDFPDDGYPGCEWIMMRFGYSLNDRGLACPPGKVVTVVENMKAQTVYNYQYELPAYCCPVNQPHPPSASQSGPFDCLNLGKEAYYPSRDGGCTNIKGYCGERGLTPIWLNTVGGNYHFSCVKYDPIEYCGRKANTRSIYQGNEWYTMKWDQKTDCRVNQNCCLDNQAQIQDLMSAGKCDRYSKGATYPGGGVIREFGYIPPDAVIGNPCTLKTGQKGRWAFERSTGQAFSTYSTDVTYACCPL